VCACNTVVDSGAGILTRSHDTTSSTIADGSTHNGIENERVEQIDKHRIFGPSKERRISDDLESGISGGAGFESESSETAAVSMADLHKNGLRVSQPSKKNLCRDDVLAKYFKA